MSGNEANPTATEWSGHFFTARVPSLSNWQPVRWGKILSVALDVTGVEYICCPKCIYCIYKKWFLTKYFQFNMIDFTIRISASTWQLCELSLQINVWIKCFSVLQKPVSSLTLWILEDSRSPQYKDFWALRGEANSKSQKKAKVNIVSGD